MQTVSLRHSLPAAQWPRFASLLLMLIVLSGLCAVAQAAERHSDPALEALLPKTLGGKALTIESQLGSELATNSTAFDQFLAALGKSRADFSLASAYGGNDLKAAIGLWRVVGTAEPALLSGFKAVMQASSATRLTMAEEQLAGRTVTRIGDQGQLANGPLYVVAKGDTLIFVQTPDRALAEEAVAKFPPL